MERFKTICFEVQSEDQTLRLDKWLAQQDLSSHEKLSRSRATQLIAKGLVRKNKVALKPSYRLQTGDLIEVQVPLEISPSSLVPLDLPLDIVFEDEDLLVVNKPSGLVVHPAAGHAQDTLVNILLHKVKNLSMGFSENRPGIVHRLDRDTSGLLVVAKNDHSHAHLAAQFKAKTTHRIYWAIAHGHLKENPTTMKTKLLRDPQNRKRYKSLPSTAHHGKLAITHFRVKKIKQAKKLEFSWLECKLETGRTHQIRVHASELGCPLVWDPIYGRTKADRHLPSQLFAGGDGLAPGLALHACELGFHHPKTGKPLAFKVPWPNRLSLMTQNLGFV